MSFDGLMSVTKDDGFERAFSCHKITHVEPTVYRRAANGLFNSVTCPRGKISTIELQRLREVIFGSTLTVRLGGLV